MDFVRELPYTIRERRSIPYFCFACNAGMLTGVAADRHGEKHAKLLRKVAPEDIVERRRLFQAFLGSEQKITSWKHQHGSLVEKVKRKRRNHRPCEPSGFQGNTLISPYIPGSQSMISLPGTSFGTPQAGSVEPQLSLEQFLMHHCPALYDEVVSCAKEQWALELIKHLNGVVEACRYAEMVIIGAKPPEGDSFFTSQCAPLYKAIDLATKCRKKRETNEVALQSVTAVSALAKYTRFCLEHPDVNPFSNPEVRTHLAKAFYLLKRYESRVQEKMVVKPEVFTVPDEEDEENDDDKSLFSAASGEYFNHQMLANNPTYIVDPLGAYERDVLDSIDGCGADSSFCI